METTFNRSMYVLLADDDADDRMLFEDAVSELNLNVDLQMVKDGEELMRYLLTSAIILPEILFMDLNMPLKTGFQCLEEIRRTKMLRDIFIVVYSTTASEPEIEEVFRKGANLFINKPNSFRELKTMLHQIFSIDLRERALPENMDRFVFKGSGAWYTR
jgi:CheY-like chemotaxis protein